MAVRPEILARMVGAEIVEVETPEETRAKISGRTAMIYVMSGRRPRRMRSTSPSLIAIAKEKGVPILVDAAAEEPLNPNPHLSRGATLVCYSGGKCLRGPQSSGILLGDKNLCQAAYYPGRAPSCLRPGAEMQQGRIDGPAWRRCANGTGAIMPAEQRMWLAWMQGIEKRLKPLPSTSFEYLEPEDLSNKATQLRVKWDANVLKITGPELAAKLDAGSPRILINAGAGRRPDQMASSVTIMPYMLDPGEAHIIAEAMHAALTNPGTIPIRWCPAARPPRSTAPGRSPSSICGAKARRNSPSARTATG